MKFNPCIRLMLLLLGISLIAACKKDNNPNGNSGSQSNQSSLLPTADFNYTISNSQIIPDTVTLNNTSKNATSYQWTLWNGLNFTTTDAINPLSYAIISYPAGPLSATLVATNSYGSATVTKQISFSTTAITGINYALANSVGSLTGVNFAAGNSQVTLNGVALTVLSATTTGVAFAVPANATSGKMVLTTNGASITTNYTVYGLSVVPLQLGGIYPVPRYNLKRIAYSYQGTNIYPFTYNINTYGVNETDSLYDLLRSKTGAAGQYVGSTFYYGLGVPPPVKMLGISANYFTGSDFNIYKIGSGMVLASTVNIAAFAGNGTSGYADGTGTGAQFISPFGITNDAAGNAYVTDAHRVRKISLAGVVTTLAGSGADGHADGQGTSATFGNLWGIAVDAAGNVYVSDTEYHNIRKITPSGTVTTFAGSGTPGIIDGTGTAAQFSFPKGIAVDGNGNLFVSDSNYNNASGPYTSALRVITPFGVVATVLSSAKGDDLSNPDGIAFEGGSLQICNTGPTAIQALLTVNFVAK